LVVVVVGLVVVVVGLVVVVVGLVVVVVGGLLWLLCGEVDLIAIQERSMEMICGVVSESGAFRHIRVRITSIFFSLSLIVIQLVYSRK